MNYKTKEDVQRVVSLGKNDNVLDIFIGSYLQGLGYEAWFNDMKAEHKLLGAPLIATEESFDAEGNLIPASTSINPLYVTFDVFMAETITVGVGTKDILDEFGEVTGTEPIYEDQLVREYVEITVDILQWRVDNYAILREANYPSVNDFLDAYVQDDQVALDAYKAKCMAVKDKFKKVK